MSESIQAWRSLSWRFPQTNRIVDSPDSAAAPDSDPPPHAVRAIPIAANDARAAAVFLVLFKVLCPLGPMAPLRATSMNLLTGHSVEAIQQIWLKPAAIPPSAPLAFKAPFDSSWSYSPGQHRRMCMSPDPPCNSISPSTSLHGPGRRATDEHEHARARHVPLLRRVAPCANADSLVNQETRSHDERCGELILICSTQGLARQWRLRRRPRCSTQGSDALPDRASQTSSAIAVLTRKQRLTRATLPMARWLPSWWRPPGPPPGQRLPPRY